MVFPEIAVNDLRKVCSTFIMRSMEANTYGSKALIARIKDRVISWVRGRREVALMMKGSLLLVSYMYYHADFVLHCLKSNLEAAPTKKQRYLPARPDETRFYSQRCNSRGTPRGFLSNEQVTSVTLVWVVQ
jgi:hypothetical protein